MPRLYAPSQPIHLISPQTAGVYDEKPEWDFVTDGFWQGPVQQIPWGTEKGGRPVAAGLHRALPGVVDLRAPFSKWYFRIDDVRGVVLHTNYESFLDEWVNSGRKLVWDFHDGITQDVAHPSRYSRWPSIYPNVQSRADLNAAFVYMHAHQIESYNLLADWLDKPENAHIKAASIGFDLMNEPGSYNEAAKDTGDYQYFYSRFIDHNEALSNFVKARFPGRFILAPMAAFNATIRPLVDTILPNRGGISALEAMRQVIGYDYLVWSMHRYPTFDRVARDLEEHKRLFIQDFRELNDDPVCVTEMNIPAEWINPSRTGHALWRGSFNAKYQSWIDADEYWEGKPAYGVTNWPGWNYANNSVWQIMSDGVVSDQYRNSRIMNYAYMARMGSDERLFGPYAAQKGAKPFQIIDAGPHNPVLPDNIEIDDWQLELLNNPAHVVAAKVDLGFSWGGAGGTLHEVPDGPIYSAVFGGDGRAFVIDNGTAYRRNHYMLGKGGGVVRTGAGAHIILSQGGRTRVYTAPQNYAVIAIPYGPDNEIIIDPDTVRVWLSCFEPSKGDKISFKGIFPDLYALRAAMRVVPNNSHIEGTHLIIDLPSGGEVLIVDGGALAANLHTAVLDFTDGWYFGDWLEPADYTAAEFDIYGPPSIEAPEASGAYYFTRDGAPLLGPYDIRGNRLLMSYGNGLLPVPDPVPGPEPVPVPDPTPDPDPGPDPEPTPEFSISATEDGVIVRHIPVAQPMTIAMTEDGAIAVAA